MIIGVILKNMRLNARLSQKKVGKILSLSDTTVSSYERGNSQPDFDIIVKYAKLCGYDFIIKTPDNRYISLEKMSKEV